MRALVLTGAGKAFCVGQDLGEHAEALRGDAATSFDTVTEHYNPIVLGLVDLPFPVVAAINGPCVGRRAWASRWPATCGSPRPG